MDGIKIVNKHYRINCEKCGHDESSVIVIEGPFGSVTMGQCNKCKGKTFEYSSGEINNRETNAYNIKCPFCQSGNVQKISEASKLASAVAFGVFSLGKVTKTWHCNNCGSNFG